MSFSVEGRLVGTGEPCFVIAEAGVNHNGDPAVARALVDAAADAGADAVKFQTWITEEIVVPDAPLARYQRRTVAEARSQFEMLKALELPHDVFRELQAHAARRGIVFLSTPDDERSADFLAGIGVPLLKIGSPEIRNLPYLRYLARFGLPLALSTGMASLDDVANAVAALEEEGARELVLLHCVSSYPADPADSNLRAMATMAEAFGYSVGFSDHTQGIEVAPAAVALGACVIEKHLTLDRDLPGPDHALSLDGVGFRAMVDAIRIVESSLGDGVKQAVPAELDAAATLQKSVVARRAIAAGEILELDDLALRRAPGGLAASELPQVVGRRAARDLQENEAVTAEALE